MGCQFETNNIQHNVAKPRLKQTLNYHTTVYLTCDIVKLTRILLGEHFWQMELVIQSELYIMLAANLYPLPKSLEMGEDKMSPTSDASVSLTCVIIMKYE